MRCKSRKSVITCTANGIMEVGCRNAERNDGPEIEGANTIRLIKRLILSVITCSLFLFLSATRILDRVTSSKLIDTDIIYSYLSTLINLAL